MQHPDSLCAIVLKAKYFPESSILDAKPQFGMSYTWCNLLRGLEILKHGVVWRVGDGEKINPWLDPWIPRGSTRRPVATQGRSIITTVSELINPITETWDEELIRDNFTAEDTRDILSIPLCLDMEDYVAWHLDSKGIFSVKSAYRLGVSIRDARLNRDASSSLTDTARCNSE
jgi:hypothetical protein